MYISLFIYVELIVPAISYLYYLDLLSEVVIITESPLPPTKPQEKQGLLF